jgi:hypothetical protein
MDIPIVELESMPQDELRALNMVEVAKRFAFLHEPHPISIESEILGNVVRVTVSQPCPRIIDYLTGKVL